MNPICHYLRWRYGNVSALKPPLGYDRRVKQPISRIILYRIRYEIWLLEDWMFQRWGGEMRRRWTESFKTINHITMPYIIQNRYLIQTQTMTLAGKLVEVTPTELVLTQASWVADTGRFSAAAASGLFAESEPFPPDRQVIVGRATVIHAHQIP